MKHPLKNFIKIMLVSSSETAILTLVMNFKVPNYLSQEIVACNIPLLRKPACNSCHPLRRFHLSIPFLKLFSHAHEHLSLCLSDYYNVSWMYFSTACIEQPSSPLFSRASVAYTWKSTGFSMVPRMLLCTCIGFL